MTDEAKALVEQIKDRLRRASINDRAYERPMDWTEAGNLIDLIETQAREIERLREALEPFTFRNLGDDEIIFLQYPSIVVRCEATYGDVQLARAALAGDSHE